MVNLAMAKKASRIPRTPSGRQISKKEGARHLIHAAIRMTMIAEDPFAIRVLIQAAEQVVHDVSKKTGKPLSFSILEGIQDDLRDEFRGIYNEVYNYLKHADRDHDKEITTGELVAMNFMQLFVCAVNYHHVFGEKTKHMHQFITFGNFLMPGILVMTDQQKQIMRTAYFHLDGFTVRSYLRTVYDNMKIVAPGLTEERDEDLIDNHEFFDKQVLEHARS
jgi:hypothetical protein